MKGHVLIIEDEQELGELIQLFLNSEGIDSVWVEDAEAGLEKLNASPFDLIILDINLPGMDGYEFLQLLRQRETVPVIIVSARTSDEDIISGLGIGADEFVTKPFKPKVLSARVRALLRRSVQYSENNREVYHFEEYELDYDGYLLKKDGKAIPLSTKEIEVLRFLVKNAGKALSPEEIYSSVWDQDYGDLTTVAVYIQRLRKKIEKDFKSPAFIQTIHGRGYLFRKEILQ